MQHYTQEPEIQSFSFYQNTTSSGLKKYKPSVKALNEIKGMDSLESSVERSQRHPLVKMDFSKLNQIKQIHFY